MIFGHGNDTYRYDDQIKTDFSTVVYDAADLSKLQAYLAAHLGVVGHYPEPEPFCLEKLIAEKLDVSEDTIMVTNGTTEAIYLIAQLYAGWGSIIPQPTFTEYEDACKTHGHLLSYNADNELDVLPENRIYWLCNPNNPTGNVLNHHLIAYIIRQHPRYMFVVDQTFADYTLTPIIQPKQMTDCHNVMILHSLSTRYCIPGLRLGYIFSSPIIINRLRQIRQPWTVNSMAIEAGKYLIGNEPRMIPDLKAYLTEAQRLHHQLSSVEGLMVMDTSTHFMLVNILKGNTQELKQWLIKHHGILIYDTSNVRGLDNHCFRVTARTPEEDDRLVAAIKEYMKEKNT